VNKSELSQLKYIGKEIEYLKKQLKEAEYQVETRMTTDSVVGSMPTYPYIQHVIKISGVDVDDYDRKVERLRRSLERRIQDLLDKTAEIQEYISTIDDSETRLILQCRFINGLTWEQIEEETGISQTTAKRKFRRWRDF
jgi:DNA-directed RNA polymerase specialized sigma subunit